MSKGKSFFGRDKDAEAAEAADVRTHEPAPAPGDLPASGQPEPASGKLTVPHGETNPETVGTTEVNPSGKLTVPHGETNPETVGTTEVNPHNEAAAQRPATLPNTAVAGHIAGRPITEIESLSDSDRLAHLRGWGKEGRTRGHVTSADWEFYEKLVGEDPEQKRVREAQAEAQHKALAGPPAAQGTADADPLGKSARDRP